MTTTHPSVPSLELLIPQVDDAKRSRRRQLIEVFPFCTSVLVHAGLILLGFFAAWTIVISPGPQRNSASSGSMGGGGGGGSPVERQAPPNWNAASVPNVSSARSVDETLDEQLFGVDRIQLPAATPYNPNALASANLQGASVGPGFGPGFGGGSGGGGGGGHGPDFGIYNGSGDGNGSIFTGKGTALVNSIYVCDASGSMMVGGKFDRLRMELHAAISNLRGMQAFNVIFFQEASCLSAAPDGLIMANSANKDKSFAFLDRVYPAGATDPIPALQLALRQKPQVIYLLTDGDFPDNQAVLNFLRKSNPGKVVINTIAFYDRGESYEKVLQTIARESGGIFKFVLGKD